MNPTSSGTRVLLFSPRIHGVRGGVNRLQPSLGLGYLAAVLESRGHTVRVFDAALVGGGLTRDLPGGDAVVIGAPDAEITAALADFRPHVVGVTVPFSNLADEALHLAGLVRAWDPSVPIVCGGNHVNGALTDFKAAASRPGSPLRENLETLLGPFDVAMAGECDFAFSDVVEALVRGDAVDGLPGVMVRRDGVVQPPASRPVVDVRALPFPARHLQSMEDYFRYGRFHSSKSTSSRVLNVMASRGCPEHCVFCSTPTTWGQKVRWRDTAHVIAEIKACRDAYGIEEVQFEDDSLSADYRRLEELCDGLAPLGISWCTPNGIKVNYHLARQPELFAKMRNAGCYQVTFACESGSQRVLDNIIGKRLQVSQIATAVKNARDAGLFVHTFWMVGFPGETRAEMERTADAAEASGADSYSVSIVTPLPGTPLYHQVVEKDLWWDSDPARRKGNYRASSIRADGFSSPGEFEQFVDSLNQRLNGAASRKEPERAAERARLIYDAQLAASRSKQT